MPGCDLLISSLRRSLEIVPRVRGNERKEMTASTGALWVQMLHTGILLARR